MKLVVSHSFFACLVSMVTLHSLSLQRNPEAGSSSEVPAALSTARGERQTCRGAGEKQGRSHEPPEGQWVPALPLCTGCWEAPGSRGRVIPNRIQRTLRQAPGATPQPPVSKCVALGFRAGGIDRSLGGKERGLGTLRTGKQELCPEIPLKY